MPGSAAGRWASISNRWANAIVVVAAVIVIGALVLVGTRLRDTQTSSREQLIARFHDRAEVVSALTQAVLNSVRASDDQVRRYGAGEVTDASLDKAAGDGRLAYLVLLDQRGVIAASGTLSAAARARILASPGVAATRAGAAVYVSDVSSDGSGATTVVDLTVALDTPAGKRVLVSGVPTALISAFLGSYLKRVPTSEGTAYVSDSRGNVVATRGPAAQVGRPVTQPGLLQAVQHGSGGPFGSGGYFAAAPVAGSTWRVVLTTSEASLLRSVSGSRNWLPWVIYAALGILALGFLAVLRRLLATTSALSTANARLAGSNARLESSNALLRHAAELTRSNAELEQFASIASHDLQEPLRKIQTFAAYLTAKEQDRLSDEGADFLRRMNAAAGRMRALIDDLLMFSRVSTKGRPFVDVDLGEVVSQVLVDLEIAIDESSAQVSIGALPTIAADPVQMRQLLQNLLGNALKFRRPGVAPAVAVTARVSDGIAELTIQDNGMGFEHQYATRIFRAFERLNGATAYPGTGIGLALCRKIVERHNGAITADGELGKGAVFTIRLPIEQPAQDPTEPLPEPMRDATHALL